MAAVLKAGPLRKRSSSAWHSRYSPRLFVLHANRLDYYLPLPELELLAAVGLDECDMTPTDASADGRGAHYAIASGQLRARFDGEAGENMRLAIASATAAVRKSVLGKIASSSLSSLPLEVVVAAALGSIPSLETFCYFTPGNASSPSLSASAPPAGAGCVAWMICSVATRTLFVVSGPLVKLVQRGSIPLFGPGWMASAEVNAEDELELQLSSGQREYSVQASTADESASWRVAIVRAIGALRASMEASDVEHTPPTERAPHHAQDERCVTHAIPMASCDGLDPLDEPPRAASPAPLDASPTGISDMASPAEVLGLVETPVTRASADGADTGVGIGTPIDPNARDGTRDEALIATGGARPICAHDPSAPGPDEPSESALAPLCSSGGASMGTGASSSSKTPSPAPSTALSQHSPGMAGAMLLMCSRLESERERHDVFSAFSRWRHFAEAQTLADVEAVLQRFVELTVASGGELVTPESLFRGSYVPLGGEYEEDPHASYAPFCPRVDAESDAAVDDPHATPPTVGAPHGRAGASAAAARGLSDVSVASDTAERPPTLGGGSADDTGLAVSPSWARASPGSARTPTRFGKASTRLAAIIDELERTVRSDGEGRPREDLLALLVQARTLAHTVRPSRSFDREPPLLEAAADGGAPAAASAGAPAARAVLAGGGAPQRRQSAVALGVHVRSSTTRRDARGRYTAYEISVSDGEMSWTVWRRYSQFEALHAYLQDERGFAPGLPPKTRLPLRARVVAIRQAELERYLTEVTGNLRAYTPVQRTVLAGFLQAPPASLARSAQDSTVLP